MQKSRSRTDLAPQKSGIKQIIRATARQPKPPTHIKEQTDGRKSKTIVRIQSSDHKRGIFPGFPARQVDCLDAPGLEQYCLDGKAEPSLQAISGHEVFVGQGWFVGAVVA